MGWCSTSRTSSGTSVSGTTLFPFIFIAGMFADGVLNTVDVRSKIVACQRKEDPIMLSEMIQKAGGVGMVSWSPRRA